MRQCPWCGRMNLNVYAYCQSCGRGFDGPEQKPAQANKRGWWPFGKKSA
ncbi:MAG TPA: hypothetical protein PKA49_05975 [Tepidiformaceae bacterium]|jgi:hypothetical protein|nr:hypothetical protein [Tepidiformaceae bacterium]